MLLGDLLPDGVSYGIVQPGTEVPGGTPILRVKDIHDDAVDVRDPLRVAPSLAATFKRTTLRGGELLLTVVGTPGRTAIAPPEVAGWNVARAIAVLRPQGVNVSWLHYLFQTARLRNQIDACLNTTVQATLNLDDVKKLAIPETPLPEQQAIAEVLGALDDKIAANRALIATAVELMTTRVSALPLSGTLQDLCSLSKQSVSPDAMEPEVWHYSLPAYDEGALPTRERREEIKSNKFVVTKPSVLLSKLNPRFPRVWNLPTPRDMSVASTEFLVLEPHAFTTSVLWALLSSPRVSGFLGEHAAGTSGSHQRVKPSEVMALPMPTEVPATLAEQLSALGLRVQTARHESAALASLRDALLPALMDGTVRVKDMEGLISQAF